MPVLKIRKNGAWVEVWGATNNVNISAPKLTMVTLLASAWVGDAEPYSQNININAATVNSKIDLQPTAEQIAALQNEETSLMIQNNGDNTYTAYAIGNKPTSDYKMQVLITEVSVV